METEQFPNATFTGRIIERIDLRKDGQYEVRAKGKLHMHGVKRERIIKSILEKKGEVIHLKSFFTVLLKEHDITVPRIVHQKIAEEIEVTIEATLTKSR